MRLSAPKVGTWWLAVVLGVLGIVLQLGVVTVAALSGIGFWLLVAGFVLFVLATLLRGL